MWIVEGACSQVKRMSLEDEVKRDERDGSSARPKKNKGEGRKKSEGEERNNACSCVSHGPRPHAGAHTASRRCHLTTIVKTVWPWLLFPTFLPYTLSSSSQV